MMSPATVCATSVIIVDVPDADAIILLVRRRRPLLVISTGSVALIPLLVGPTDSVVYGVIRLHSQHSDC